MPYKIQVLDGVEVYYGRHVEHLVVDLGQVDSTGHIQENCVVVLQHLCGVGAVVVV